MIGRLKTDGLVLLGYLAISFAYVGWQILPHPGRYLIGGFTRDPEIHIWSFVWWPYAIGHWTNPFVTHALYAPSGINLTWTASALPGLALAFAPVTLLFGAAVAYNVAAIALPALSAWTAYLLCRHLTRSLWASLIGGYLYGFSSAILLEELWGNIYVTGIFLLPLVALVLVRYLQGGLSARGLAWRLGVLLAAQLWIATEFAFTATLVLLIGLLLAFWLVPDMRPRLRATLRPIAGGYALGALLAAPFVVYTLSGLPPGPFWATPAEGSDLLSFAVPTSGVALGGTTWASAHLRAGGGAYLGLPVLVIMGAFAVRSWRSGWTRVLIAGTAICAVLALGTKMQVAGRNTIRLPLSLTAHLPVFNDLLPFRFAVYVSLAAAVIVALWTATTRGRLYARPYLLPALAVAALVPAVWQSSFRSSVHWRPPRPTFFAAGLYKKCIPQGETVAIFPFGYRGDSLLWQAESNLWFRMAGDGLLPVAHGTKAWTSFDADWVVTQLNLNEVGRPTMDTLLAFVALHHVDRVLSVAGSGYPDTAQMRRFGPTQELGGMLVAPACGQPSLASRNLTPYVVAYRKLVQSQPNIGYCLGPYFNTLPEGLDPVGALQGAKPASFVAGKGLTCATPPAGYKRHGYATAGVPAHTYPLYTP